MLIDTHCHLDFSQFDFDREEAIKRAIDSRVTFILNVGSSIEGSRRSIELAKKYEQIFASVGVHPHEVGIFSKDAIENLRIMLKEPKVLAIGEVGLDYFKSEVPKETQKKYFKDFIEMAKIKDLPLIIHNREANKDILEILKNSLGTNITGVMHCFSGDENFLKDCLDLGLYVSFTCNLTFKNAGRLREIAKRIPIERLLLETDAPFLAPQVFRGKRNEPSYIKYLAWELAGIKGISFEEVARITSENAVRLFRFFG